MQGARRGTRSRDLGSRPEPKADAPPLSLPGIPDLGLLWNVRVYGGKSIDIFDFLRLLLFIYLFFKILFIYLRVTQAVEAEGGGKQTPLGAESPPRGSNPGPRGPVLHLSPQRCAPRGNLVTWLPGSRRRPGPGPFLLRLAARVFPRHRVRFVAATSSRGVRSGPRPSRLCFAPWPCVERHPPQGHRTGTGAWRGPGGHPDV